MNHLEEAHNDVLAVDEVRTHVIKALEQVDLLLGSYSEDAFQLGADLRDCLRPALRVITVYLMADEEAPVQEIMDYLEGNPRVAV